jgi:hypothetical protein
MLLFKADMVLIKGLYDGSPEKAKQSWECSPMGEYNPKQEMVSSGTVLHEVTQKRLNFTTDHEICRISVRCTADCLDC